MGLALKTALSVDLAIEPRRRIYRIYRIERVGLGDASMVFGWLEGDPHSRTIGAARVVINGTRRRSTGAAGKATRSTFSGGRRSRHGVIIRYSELVE